MKTIIKPVYYCDYCKKHFISKYFAEKHEIFCHKNPKNDRACFNCRHLSRETFDYYFDTGFGESSRKVDILFCNKLEIGVYPPKVEIKKNFFDFGDFLNEPMPKNCDKFEEINKLEIYNNWPL